MLIFSEGEYTIHNLSILGRVALLNKWHLYIMFVDPSEDPLSRLEGFN